MHLLKTAGFLLTLLLFHDASAQMVTGVWKGRIGGRKAEVKIVQCTRGRVYDVALDLRPASATFKRWAAVELSDRNYRSFYIPEGCAHGYLTLEDDAVLTYSTSRPYAPQHARGVRFDDPAFAIQWPAAAQVISAADRNWPDFT